MFNLRLINLKPHGEAN